jgi:hypothetical protein
MTHFGLCGQVPKDDVIEEFRHERVIILAAAVGLKVYANFPELRTRRVRFAGYVHQARP